MNDAEHREGAATSERAGGPLLAKRRFGPFFVTQFLGAFNDNLFKNALTALVAFGIVQVSIGRDVLVNMGLVLFIVPFFLFSALAGQIADSTERSLLIRRLKMTEVAIATLAAVGMLTSSLTVMFAALCLFGVQSAFFGPVKYALLPQHLELEELSRGNGLVEMGTFIAILLGTLLGALVAEYGAPGRYALAAGTIGVALAGLWSSRFIPLAPAPNADMKLDWNVWRATRNVVRDAAEVRSVLLSVLGVSWFWFFGSLFITQVPNYTVDVLKAGPSVNPILLAAFTIGIAVGSLLCAWASGRRIELGLVPIGAFGMTVFGIHLALAAPPVPAVPGATIDAGEFLASAAGIRIFVDLVLVSISGGYFIVPLYAFIQHRSIETHRARVIAANNILNALFMVASGLMAIALLRSGLSIPELYGVVALMNVAVSVYIFWQVPEFVVRLMAWLLVHSLYRVTNAALANIPREGAALLVCNHVSYVDGLLILAVSPRPIRFVMYHQIFNWPVLRFLFRCAKAIPIAPAREDAQMLERAYEAIAGELEDGELVCIFPEGRLTGDGEIGEFRPGVDRIVARTPVPVVPLALRGVWGSLFSRQGGRALSRLPGALWRRIEVVSAPALAPTGVSAPGLKAIVAELRGTRA